MADPLYRRFPSGRYAPTDRVAVDARELGTLLVCSQRYALGRMTYMPGLVADAIRRHWSDLDEGSRHTLRRDLDEAIRDAERGVGSLGMDCDAATWRGLAEWMAEVSRG